MQLVHPPSTERMVPRDLQARDVRPGSGVARTALAGHDVDEVDARIAGIDGYLAGTGLRLVDVCETRGALFHSGRRHESPPPARLSDAAPSVAAPQQRPVPAENPAHHRRICAAFAERGAIGEARNWVGVSAFSVAPAVTQRGVHR
jgi:hypothetical protein